MAATRLIAMHVNKGKSIGECLKARTDYAKNGEKTQDGEYVSSYQCCPETVDQEFLLAKQEYFRITGRKPKGDIIAWQIRQSFKPGEVTPEEANRIGYETAMHFTHGEHAFLVATHTDRAHIHNHIIFNSTALSCDRKFKDSWFVALALQRVSDLVCLEHALSVIVPRKPGERDNKSPYHRISFRNVLKDAVDEILEKNPENFEEFLKALREKGYEIKAGKYPAVRGNGQKRFIRFRSLGRGYTEEDIRKRIAGAYEEDLEPEKKRRRRYEEAGPGEESKGTSGRNQCGRSRSLGKTARDFDLLIDINRKMREGKGKGYERWAKTYNVKQVSKALLFLQEHGIRDYADLENKAKGSAEDFHRLSDGIKEKEKRLQEIASLRTQIISYVKTKDVYTAYRKSGYSRKFLEEHREEISLHKAAKKAFDELELKKIPRVKDLTAEYSQVLAEKRKLYEGYRDAKKEMMDYQIAKQDIDRFLKIDKEEQKREQQNTRHR